MSKKLKETMEQKWADAATENCIWILQTRWIVGKLEDDEVPEDACWQTEAVFLTRLEAFEAGARRSYHYGTFRKDWRIYGVPARGEMVTRLAAAGVTQEYIDNQVEHYRKEIEAWRKECPKVFRGSRLRGV